MVGAFINLPCNCRYFNLKNNKRERFPRWLWGGSKYGLLGDYNFYCWLETNFAKIKERDTKTLIEAVAHSCEMKAEIVINDEKNMETEHY